MLNRLAVVLGFAGVLAEGGSASQAISWSGHWTSRGSHDVAIVRVVPGSGTARGWNGFVEALVASREYRIVRYRETLLEADRFLTQIDYLRGPAPTQIP